MPRLSRGSSRSSNAAEEDLDPQDNSSPDVDEQQLSAAGGSRKRRSNVEEDEEEDEEVEMPRPQPKRRGTGGGRSGNDGGGGGSGTGDHGGGSGSGNRRLSGFDDIAPSQEDGPNNEPNFEFSQSADSARDVVAQATAAKSQDLQTNAKDDKKANELSETERASLIKSMMRFLIMKGLNREPATKKEMMELVLGKNYRGKGVHKYVLAKAGDLIRSTVGFRVKSVASDKAFAVKDTYYVINELNSSKHASLILQNQGQAARGLLMVILCFLFCNFDKIITEDELFKNLHDKVDKRIPATPEATTARGAQKPKLRVNVDGLGDVHEHLATFVKQHYLVKSSATRPTADGGVENVTSYSMGARSYLEIGSLQIATVMAELMGTKVDPSLLIEMDDLIQSQSQSQEATPAK